MVPTLLISVLSLVFFSALLAAELQAFEPQFARQLVVIVAILLGVVSYEAHAFVLDSWPIISDAREFIERLL